MRAIVLEQYGDPEVLTFREVPDPAVGPGTVRVRIAATALNRADLLQRRGLYPPPEPRPEWEIPGLEFAGIVDQVGPGVAGVREGDRVMGLLPGGGYAEAVVTSDRLLLPVPPSLSLDEAAAVPEATFTAYDALEQIAVRLGDWVLIHAAASGVGTMLIQLARRMGLRIIATCGSDAKAETVRALGADVVVNYRRTDFLEAVRDATGGAGVAGVLDLVGAEYFDRNLRALAVGGRMIIIGTVGGNQAPLNLGALLSRRLHLIGTALRSRPVEEKMLLTQKVLRHVLPDLAAGRIRPVIDRVYPWTEAAEAHRRMEANLNTGKIVLHVA
jgi:putative PIG3 family NAD(P)H quinone oxidoreductase